MNPITNNNNDDNNGHNHDHHCKMAFWFHNKLLLRIRLSYLILIIMLYLQMDLIMANETEIVLDDSSITSRSNTFYSVESSSSSNSSNNDNDTMIEVENEANADDFWDAPTLPVTVRNDSINLDDDITSTTMRTTTTFLPPMPSITWSTLPPPFTNIRRTSPFAKPGDTTENNESENSIAETNGRIWKIILHGTNMNSEELKMCNKTLIENHFKPSSRRKVARNIKKELEKIFSKWNYRFSIMVSSTSRNTMGKALHGVWMSISINGIHYFITATHAVVDGPKIKEEQMEKIEYMAHVHAIGARNMTGYRKYNRIAAKLKLDLDRFYGNGNVWSVVVVKNPLLVKAKIFEDPEYHIEFTRLNGGHFIVFRGGKNIEDVVNRNARDLELVPESDDNSLETETEHEDYRNNIYLVT